MSKALTFTNEQKSLIWSQFVQPVNGTESEAKHFIEVCEEFGLNPLLGDIVFQRYETKNGPIAQFITKRDGLLRVAARQPDYVGPPNANVVKEGDHFEFLPSEGTVNHKFGTKRGKILGAYAILKHAKHNPVAVFVDFEEYFQANSGKLNSRYGNANIWDKMPSAMIIKVAEAFVLKRQFPLGILYTQEELGLDDDLNNDYDQEGQAPTPNTVPKNNPNGNNELIPDKKAQNIKIEHSTTNLSDKKTNRQQIKGLLKAFELKKSGSGKNYGLMDVLEEQSNKILNVLVKDERIINSLQNTPMESTVSLAIFKENGFTFLEECLHNTPQTNEAEADVLTGPARVASNQKASGEPVQTESEEVTDYEVWNGVIKAIQAGQKGQTKYVKMAFQTNDGNQGNQLSLLAHGDKTVDEALSLKQDQPVSILVKQENGFNFFLGIHPEQNVQVG